MKNRKKLAVSIATLALAIPAFSCSSSTSGIQSSGDRSSVPTSMQVDSEATQSIYPLVLETTTGEISIEEKPMRILSLSPTATEILFAVGAADQVLAVDDQSNYPPEAPTSGISGYSPNLEAILICFGTRPYRSFVPSRRY